MRLQITSASLLLAILILLSSGMNGYAANSRTNEDDRNQKSIDWSPDVRLKWSDFKAASKPTRGFAVAASTCGFGYDGLISDDKILINVYVRFYKKESWHDQRYNLPDVLEHEQLHFDICELFGRLLYREVVNLRRKGELTERNLEITYDQLIGQYDKFQDRYDEETDHSTVASKQREWNTKIRVELNRLANYSDYKEF